MDRTYLAVPYEDKDAAKALGAKWDKEERSWYIHQGTTLDPFAKWTVKTEKTVTLHSDVHAVFATAITDAGLVLKGQPLMDGKIHRVPAIGDERGQNSGAYVGHLDGHPAGYIQNYKTGERHNWKLNRPTPYLNSQDKARLNAETAQKRQERAQEIELVHQETALIVQTHWDKATSANNHPYLLNKGVQAYGLKLDTTGQITIPKADPKGQQWSKAGNLLMPIHDIDGKLWSVQSIDETGRKSLPRGARKQGGHHVIGDLASSNKILFAEGYATAATLHELSGLPVVVTIDAGNMPVVAEAYRKQYPDKTLLIAGDNDHTKPLAKNVGLQKAQETAQKVGGYTLLPTFSKGSFGSDWNDLVKSMGKEEVRVKIQARINIVDREIQAHTNYLQKKIERQKQSQTLDREQKKSLSLSR